MNNVINNIKNTLKGRKILFIENSNSLSDDIERFSDILSELDLPHTVLYNINDLDRAIVLSSIVKNEVIVFQTTWVYPISKELKEFIASLKDKKIIVEAYIHEPTWFYASQHGTHHDVYIFSSPCKAADEHETFYKLTEKPYWDYENGFDK